MRDDVDVLAVLIRVRAQFSRRVTSMLASPLI
jgi:hypothetical protein